MLAHVGRSRGLPVVFLPARTAAYSPCLVLEAQGLTPLPLSATLFHTLRGVGGEIIWLYGLPEVFVGIVCFLFSFGIRLVNAPATRRDID